MKKTLFSMFAILACVCSFVACGNDDEEKKDDITIVGNWTIDGTPVINVTPENPMITEAIQTAIKSFTFTADNKVEGNLFITSYVINGNKLSLELAPMAQSILGKSLECTYTLDANKLAIKADVQVKMQGIIGEAPAEVTYSISVSANYNRTTNWPY